MTIELTELGKRFQSQWIFKGLNMRFESEDRIAITGPNGSGKSTLVRVLCAAARPSEGKISYFIGNAEIEDELVFRHISLAAPYLELIEEFTLDEAIHFQRHFKGLHPKLDVNQIKEWLPFSKHKLIREYSSGMKQRLKLVLAICANTDLLILDEPTTNLDKQGQLWYRDLLDRFAADRILFIASNEPSEYQDIATKVVDITDFKKTGKT